jgi:protein lin-9
LPKARRFVFCEFFYSGVDQQIFLAENEFAQLMAESFPNLKSKKIRKPEWREVHRLIGKPRRCSQTFFAEERSALEEKR